MRLDASPRIRGAALLTAMETGVTQAEMASESRSNRIVKARWIMIRRLYGSGVYTAASLARKLELDHTTVLLALDRLPSKGSRKHVEVPKPAPPPVMSIDRSNYILQERLAEQRLRQRDREFVMLVWDHAAQLGICSKAAATLGKKVYEQWERNRAA